MNVKNRALFLVCLIILFLSGFLLEEGISHFNAEIDNAVQEQEKIIDGITRDIKEYSFKGYLFKIKHFVEENDMLRQAFADRDRELLYHLSLLEYRYLHGENMYFHAMDFNLPDGTVFLRVQKPELFGDNIMDSRPIVAEVHNTLEQRFGFDIGKHGAIFWVVQPIVHNGEYLGLVEFGIEVKQLEKALAESLGSEVTSILKANQWQKAELVEHGFQEYDDYVLMTSGKTLFDQVAQEVDLSLLEDQKVDIEGRNYVLHSCSLLDDYRGERIGRLMLFQDITNQVLKKKTYILHTVLLTTSVLAASLVVIYFSFNTLIGRLEEYAAENKRAREELQIAHDKMEDRVKQRTVDLAKTNARLEDEVTIRRRAESRLDDQRRFLETIIESLSHPFYVIDAESYQIIMANRAARSISGVDTYRGMTCYAMTHHAAEPCSTEGHPCPLAEVKKTGQPVIVEHVHYDRENKEHIFEIHAYPVLGTDGSVAQIVEYNIDITDRKHSEEEKDKLRAQLLASQKMEAVGILAGGVAHDFNNILTTILGYSQIMALRLEEGHPMRDMVNDIYDAAEKATGLTRQLLAFSRKQVMEVKVISLNTIVEDISKMLTRLIGEDVRMRLSLADLIGNIKGDVGQIEQVIMNLVINARDAMPNGGELTIETGQIELDEKYTAIHHNVQPGLYAMLTVTDTGVGISPEIREKIFEPFFTTKKRGQGTGLGLATVYGIVRQHNGHIYVYSEPGKGTTFKIYLPVVGGAAEEVPRKEIRTMPLGTETIMVVDDDSSIRRLIRDTLEPLGYAVIEAGSGEDALALLKKTEQEVHMVLSDLIMPGINGQELVDFIRQDKPEIKSIIMSGYTDNIVVKQGVLKPGVIFLNKPLLPISLAIKVRDVLDGDGGVRKTG